MDKKEAADFVINQLVLGHDIEIIVSDLSKSLRAPKDLVKRFVMNVAGTYTPPTIQEEPIPPSPEVDTKSSQFESIIDDDNFRDNSIDIETGTTEISYPDEHVESDTLSSHPMEKLQQTVDEDKGRQQEFDQQELTELVLNSIKKHRRHNDIVEEICSLTGMHWNEAQRFVARTQTKHHSSLSKSNRTLMIVFSAMFVIGGGLLLVWSIYGLLDYFNAFTADGISTLPTEFIYWVAAGLVSSLGIIGGGIFGLVRAITNH